MSSGQNKVGDVAITVNEQTIYTDVNGAAAVMLPKGTYDYSIVKQMYITKAGKVSVTQDNVTLNIDIVLKEDISNSIIISDLEKPYTGSDILPTINTNGIGYITEYEGINGTVYTKTNIPPKDIGSYSVTVTITSEQYIGTKTAIMEIRQKVAKPYANVSSGLCIISKDLVLSTSTQGAQIYYTVDGQEPTINSNRYEGAITIDKNINTVKVIAVKDGYYNSDVLVLELIPTPLYDGNVNLADKIDMLDAFKILKYMASLQEFTQPQIQSADANKDGKINILDALLIQRYSLFYSEEQ
ncbi:MAG: hypothetical protein GX800_07850 [Clostridiaceae bacterium]|nr:hypothetical protein [Clostridiaceae bacterium]